MATTLTTSHVTKAFEKIVDPFRNQGASLSEVMETIEAYADPNIVFHVVGQEFSLGCHVTGFEAMKNHVQNQMAPSYLSALDSSKEGQQKIVQVIGGVDDKAAIQFEGRGVSSAGKPWLHESLLVLEGNGKGKFAKVTAFMDTLHLENHFLQSNK